MLYRVFPHRPGAGPGEPGGPLYVARDRQGAGRHDNPDHYGALYASASAESAVAERIQAFRGQMLADQDLTRTDGTSLALAGFDDARLAQRGVVDLDEPRELTRRRLRPSRVATGYREVTQPMALAIHAEGVPGFAWWSALEASWRNVTLFAELAVPLLASAGDPQPLTVESPEVRAAAELLGIELQPAHGRSSGRGQATGSS